jgi:hypothetical protein
MGSERTLSLKLSRRYKYFFYESGYSSLKRDFIPGKLM